MNLFESYIKIGLDSSEVNSGINDLKTSTLTMGDVLKANLISDAVQKGITFVVDGLKKMGDLAISFGKSAISSSIEFESAFTGVKKTVDATEEDLQRFGGSQEAFYKDLSGWIKEEATQTASTKERIADVMAISGQLGVRGSENLKKFTETMIMMGDSTDLSAEEAAMSIAQLMNITGDSYDNTDKLGSAIVALGNNFATTEPQIVNMAQRLASTGTISNLSATEIVALATAMSTVGIQAEAGGTAMTQTLTAISQAVSGAGQTSEEYSKAQEKVRKKTQALEKAELAYQQALEKSGVSSAKAQTALNNVEKAQSKYNAAVEKYGENSPQAVQAMQNLENAQIKYNDVLSSSSDKVQTAALKVTQAQEDLTIAQKALDDAASGASGSLGLIAKVAGMSADQFAETWKTKPIEAITEFIKGLGTLEERGMDINQVLGTLEMDGVRQGNMLKSLSLATDQLTGTLEVANKAYEEGNALSEEAGTRYEDTASKISQMKEAYSNLASEIGDSVKPQFNDFLDLVKTGFINMTEGFSEGGFKGLFEALKTSFNDILDYLTQQMPDFMQAGDGLVDSIMEGIKKKLPEILAAGQEIFVTFIDGLGERLTFLIDMGGQFLVSLAEGIKANLPQIITTAVSIILTLVQGLQEAIPYIAETAVTIITGLAEGLAENYDTIIPAAVDLLITFLTALIDNLPILFEAGIHVQKALIDGIMEALPTLLERLPELIVAIVEALIMMAPQLLSVGPQLILSLITGILNALPDLVALPPRLITEFIASLLNDAPRLIGSGVEVLARLIEGIVSAIPDVAATIPEMFLAIISAITDGLGDIVEAGSNIGESIHDGLQDVIDSALDWGRDLIDNFIDGLMDKWEDLKSTVRDIADSIKDFLGFSVPEKGPLADADTYAPDMMKLFAKGIKDNERLVTDQIEDSFNFGKVIEDQDFGFHVSGSASAVSGGSASMDRVVALLQRIVDEGLHSDIDLKGDAADIFSLVRRKNHEFTEATGYSGL